MKVGIVTESLYNNYGGILQNFALQKVLAGLGHSPVTMDFMPSLPLGRYVLYACKNIALAAIPSKRKPIKPYRHFLERPVEIQNFIDRNMAMTEPLERYSVNAMKRYGIEALVVGSDQVWRKEYNPYLEDMFLKFAEGADCKKVAYAASFGLDSWNFSEAMTASCRTLAHGFDRISVREESARRLCREYLGVAAEVVLDPTLLLSEKDYALFCKQPENVSEPYLASYILDADVRKQKMVEDFAARKGLTVKNMTVSDRGCSIEEWLSTVRYAEFVVTDSFHGSVFSIIFHKRFFTFLNRSRGSDRFYTLFRALELSDRILDGTSLPAEQDADIDYSKIDARLEKLRENGIGFLKNSLK